MPIIVSMVPNSATKQVCDQVREDVRQALEKEGVLRKNVTVEFLTCAFPERLVINYKSRSDHLRKSGQADREARIVGGIIATRFGAHVECLVTSLKKKDTGIFLI